MFKIDVYLFRTATFQPGNYFQPTKNSDGPEKVKFLLTLFGGVGKKGLKL